jgi:hypothetical protein
MATTLFEDLLKKAPDVPDWQNIDPTKVQQDTVAGNLTTFEGAKDLAAKYDDYMVAQMQKRLQATFPEWSGLEAQGAKVISDRLAGRLSDSDAAASQRGSAARALGLGIAGSPAGSALTLRDLGIKQSQAQSEGLAALPGFASTVSGVKAAPKFDFGSVFLSAPQRWQMTFQNQAAKWNQQWLTNQIDAMQIGNVGMAFAKQGDEDIEMAKQAAVSYFGGGLGGGSGGGQTPLQAHPATGLSYNGGGFGGWMGGY